VLLGELTASQSFLRLASYNLENYLLTDRHVDGIYCRDYPKPEKEKTALRSVIRLVDADIIALQEIGEKIFLEELQRDLSREGLDYPFSAHMRSSDPIRHLAFLSKVPINAIRRYEDLTFTRQGEKKRVLRGLLGIEVTLNGKSCQIYTCHLKSRFSDDASDPESNKRRLGEAQAIRSVLLRTFKETPDVRMILMGDLNDAPNSAVIRRFQSKGDVELFDILPASDSRGESWTFFQSSAEYYSRIDYIFVSKAASSLVVGKRAHLSDPSPTLFQASDHRPIYVDLMLSQSQP
jgi:endonuclease/exonuclease/phosphatase family metal-dependent hydrolase